MKRILVTATLLLLLGGGGAAFVHFGLYNIAATEQHTGPVYWLLERAMVHSIRARTEAIEVPDLTQKALLDEGQQLYVAQCQQCHGGPGVAPEPFALGMTPVPANLVLTARHWDPPAIYWAIKHGIKMTGMPAWAYRMSDRELWATVAFVEQLPYITPVHYRRIAATPRPEPRQAVLTDSPAADHGTPADVQNGKRALSQYACGTCHVIPGIVGANRQVGPPLTGIASRKYIAGVLPNNFDNMVRWLMAPHEVDPLSAMPDLYVNEEHARDMAAYLYTLKGSQ